MQRTDGDGSFEIELVEATIETGLRGQREAKLEALGTIDVRVEEVQRGGEPRSALVVTFSTGPAAAGRSCESVISLSPGAWVCVRSARARRRPGARQLARDAHSLTHSLARSLTDIPKIMETMRDVIVRAARSA